MILTGRLERRSGTEIAERKGLGHPDSIMDALAEEVSRALSKYYLENFGEILHHNVDKGLLVGGEVEVSYGGGKVVKPVKIYIAGRATKEWEGKKVEVEEIAKEAVEGYLRQHLPKLAWELKVEIRASAPELSAIVHKGLANDTSFGVGFAPFSPLERAVLTVEQRLQEAKGLPFLGKDIKVMGRAGGEKAITVAAAFMAEDVRGRSDYIAYKEAVKEEVKETAEPLLGEVEVEVNVGDDVERDLVYLTLSGTSAEHGDDGQVGRGNRMNGLITPMRPMSLEAVAGKHPKAHVGKVYNAVANLTAQQIWDELGVENEVYLLSAIGKPVAEPKLALIRLSNPEKEGKAKGILRYWLESTEEIAEMFVKGKLKVW